MSEKPPPKPIFRAADRAATPARTIKHPLNPASEALAHSLADAVGLQRVGLLLLRVPPGKESFVYHSHHLEEEFLYVLSGRAMIEIGEETHELGPGDFVGFTAPSVGHHLRNPFNEDVVYLSGGERRESEVADFPRHDKRMVRVGRTMTVYPLSAGQTYSIKEE